MVEFVVPINLVVRIKDIDEDELENYITSLRLGLHDTFYSTDSEDDHFEIAMCEPEWNRIRKEVW